MIEFRNLLDSQISHINLKIREKTIYDINKIKFFIKLMIILNTRTRRL